MDSEFLQQGREQDLQLIPKIQDSVEDSTSVYQTQFISNEICVAQCFDEDPLHASRDGTDTLVKLQSCSMCEKLLNDRITNETSYLPNEGRLKNTHLYQYSTANEEDKYQNPSKNESGHKRNPPPISSRKKLRQRLFEKPPIKTRFSDVVGHGLAKLRLDEMLLPLALPLPLARSILRGVRDIPASVLLYGPPGCGKTQLAHAVAGEAQAAFMDVGPSDVLSKFVGESEASIKGLFLQAKEKALQMESLCTVLFFDEIDALGQSRGGTSEGHTTCASGGENSSRRVLAELLIQLTKNLNRYENNESSEDDNESDYLSDERNDDDDDDDNDGNDDNDDNDDNDGDEGEREENRSQVGPQTFRDRIISVTEPIINDNHKRIDVKNQCQDSPNNYDETKSRKFDYISAHNAPSVSFEKHKVESNEPYKNCNQESKMGKTLSAPSDYSNKAVDKTRNARIIIIAATNRPDDCDPALLRRFVVQMHIGLPTKRDRKRILTRLLIGIDHTITDQHLSYIAKRTDQWSGSDLESLARDAVMAPVRECLRRAAIMKKKAKQSGKHKSDDSSQITREIVTSEGNDIVRDCLLNGFKNLRSVCMKDFEGALQSQSDDNLKVGQDNTTQVSIPHLCHYDSESSCDFSV